MSEAETVDEDSNAEPPKKSRKGLLIGVILFALLGGGGFYAGYSGLLSSSPDKEPTEKPEEEIASLPPVSFVELDPLIISLGTSDDRRHLRFRASLEVVPEHTEDVRALIPRVMDVLNSYLRAVEIEMIEDPRELLKLRAQMLRRIQIVTGEGRVRDLLVLEFVLN